MSSLSRKFKYLFIVFLSVFVALSSVGMNIEAVNHPNHDVMFSFSKFSGSVTVYLEQGTKINLEDVPVDDNPYKIFIGWSIGFEDERTIVDFEELIADGHMNFYPVYEIEYYTVNIHYGDKVKRVIVEEGKELSKNNFPKVDTEEVNFKGWYRDSYSDAVDFQDPILVWGDTDIYARLDNKENGITFIDGFKHHIRDVPYNDFLKLDQIPSVSHEEYEFVGWFTETNGRGRQIAPLDFKIKDVITLYSYFRPRNTVYVEFNSGRAGDSDFFTPGEIIEPWRFSFYDGPAGTIGWFIEEDGKAIQIDTESFRPYRDTIIYSHYIFDTNGVTLIDGGRRDHIPAEFDETVYAEYVDEYAPIRYGYNFLGWFAEPEGKGFQYIPETHRITGAELYYAHYERKIHNVTFDLSGELTTTVMEHEELFDLTKFPVSNISGKKVVGWSYMEKDTHFVLDTEVDRVDRDVTLIAEYEPIIYNVQVTTKNGTYKFETLYGTSLSTIIEEKINLEESDFVGLFTEPNGKGTKVQISKFKVENDIELYAFYEDQTIVIPEEVPPGSEDIDKDADKPPLSGGGSGIIPDNNGGNSNGETQNVLPSTGVRNNSVQFGLLISLGVLLVLFSKLRIRELD